MIVPADAVDLISGNLEIIEIWRRSKKPGYLIQEGSNINIHLGEQVYPAQRESLIAIADEIQSKEKKSLYSEAVRKNREYEEKKKTEKKVKKPVSFKRPVIKKLKDVNEAVAALKSNPAFEKGIVATRVTEEKSAEYNTPHCLEYGIYSFLKKEEINLYSHQAKAIEAAVNKKNVIITTPTASGKTFAFLFPVLNSIIKNPGSRALLIYPTKALISDQLKAIRELAEKICPGISVEKYDGDTTPEKRRYIRQKHPSVIITNPDMLNIGILPNHRIWSSLFSNLDYVIMDEAHTYRGVFGSHIALLTRRLKLVCQRYGSSPNFILSSATIANPAEHAENLTGENFVLVNKSGSKQNEKTFIFYQAPFQASAIRKTAELLAFLAMVDVQTLCFARTRRGTELIADAAKAMARKNDSGVGIVAYRSGYRVDERAHIEADIKNRRVTGICSTNALELGIDIGSLDCVIISGYPGSVMSTWQQAGRAGRKDSPALVIFMGFSSPMERYILSNPDEFFERSSEHAAIDTTNKYILSDHLVSAMMENGFLSGEHGEIFGCDIDAALEVASKSSFYKHLIKKSGNRWVPVRHEHVQGEIKIRNSSRDVFAVKCRGRLVETLSEEQVYREGHEGAIILHGDTRYRVKKLDFSDRTVTVSEEDTENFTIAQSETSIKITGTEKSLPAGDLSVNFGSMIVQENYYKYDEYDSKEKIREIDLDLRPVSIDTKGIWFTVPDDVRYCSGIEEKDFFSGLKGVENLLSVVIPHFVLCDPNDIRCVAYDIFAYTMAATVIVSDNFMGGIGLSEKAGGVLYDIFRMALDIAAKCRCKNGCISCVYSNRDRDDVKPDKKAAIKILEGLISHYFSDNSVKGSESAGAGIGSGIFPGRSDSKVNNRSNTLLSSGTPSVSGINDTSGEPDIKKGRINDRATSGSGNFQITAESRLQVFEALYERIISENALKCKICGSPVKIGYFNRIFRMHCTNPKCRNADRLFFDMIKKTLSRTDIKCPDCGSIGPMEIKFGNKGVYLRCSRFVETGCRGSYNF
jgi:DEAD/DEAH box helicase domain-containing protein